MNRKVICIKSDRHRGEYIIKMLEDRGGKNKYNFSGRSGELYYYIYRGIIHSGSLYREISFEHEMLSIEQYEKKILWKIKDFYSF